MSHNTDNKCSILSEAEGKPQVPRHPNSSHQMNLFLSSFFTFFTCCFLCQEYSFPLLPRKLLFILQNPVTYSLLWKTSCESSISAELEKNYHTKLFYWIFITWGVLLLTSLGLKTCLNQYFFSLLYTSASYIVLLFI